MQFKLKIFILALFACILGFSALVYITIDALTTIDINNNNITKTDNATTLDFSNINDCSLIFSGYNPKITLKDGCDLNVRNLTIEDNLYEKCCDNKELNDYSIGNIAADEVNFNNEVDTNIESDINKNTSEINYEDNNINVLAQNDTYTEKYKANVHSTQNEQDDMANLKNRENSAINVGNQDVMKNTTENHSFSQTEKHTQEENNTLFNNENGISTTGLNITTVNNFDPISVDLNLKPLTFSDKSVIFHGFNNFTTQESLNSSDQNQKETTPQPSMNFYIRG